MPINPAITETEPNRIDSLIEEHISFFGKDKALTLLKYHRKKCEEAFNDAGVVMVLDAIFEEFGITYSFLVHGARMSHKRVSAMKLACYCLLRIKNVKPWKSSFILDRNKRVLYLYTKEVENSTDPYIKKLKEKLTKKLS